MKRIIAASFLLLALGLTPLMADDASHRAYATQLIDLLQVKQTMKQAFDNVIYSTIDQMAAHGLPEAGVTELKTTIDKWYDSEIHFEDIQPKLVEAYVGGFSEAELKQIVDFYKSDVGKKVISEMPDLMKQGSSIAQEYTKDKIPSLNAELTPILAKYRDQMVGASGGGGAPAPESAPPSAPPGGGQ
jgi:uncharacterized protein